MNNESSIKVQFPCAYFTKGSRDKVKFYIQAIFMAKLYISVISNVMISHTHIHEAKCALMNVSVMVFSDTVHVCVGKAHELILEFHHKNGLVLIDFATVIPLWPS